MKCEMKSEEELTMKIKAYFKIMKEGNPEQILSIITQIDNESNLIDPKIIECKVHALTQLGKHEEALKISETLPISSETRRQIHQYWKLVNEKPINQEEMETLQRLVEFSDKNGVYHKKASLVYFDHDNRGIVANSKILKDEIIISVPEKLFIYPELGKLTKIGQKIEGKLESFIEKNNLDSSIYVYTNLFILNEMNNPESFWKPFIYSFQKSVKTNPMLFSEEEKLLCKGTLILNHYQNHFEYYQKTYDLVCQNAPEFTEVSFEKYITNMIIFDARNFTFSHKKNISYEDSTIALCPFLDMVNYNQEFAKKTTWTFDFDERKMVLKAENEIEIGEQIYLNYGIQSIDGGLFIYSFVDSSIKNVKKEFFFKIEENDPNFEEKIAFFEPLLFDKIKFPNTICITFNRECACITNQGNFQFLRLFLSKKTISQLKLEFPIISKIKKFEPDICPTFLISQENELDVFNWIYTNFSKGLDSFHPFWNTPYDISKLSINEKNIEYSVSNTKLFFKEMIKMAESAIEYFKSSTPSSPKYKGEFSYFYYELNSK